MLDQLRRGASSWVAKILMAILVVSFGVWGIADVFTGFGQNIVAEVGGTEIPAERFQRDYTRAVQTLGQQAGRQISPQQAAQIGIPQQVLGRLVTEAVMSNVARDLGLGVSTEELGRQIRDDPSFKNAAGDFDRERMRQLLASSDLTEDEYVAAMQGVADRRQIADGLIGGLTVPKPLLEAVDRYQNQERSIRYLEVTQTMVPAVTAPTEEQLATFFDANKARFRAPEYRSFSVLLADPAKLADPAAVSDDDARRAYDAETGRFGTPERRRIEQIVFPDRASADEAARRLGEGGAIDAIIAERKLTKSDVELGLIPKTELIDPAVADAAFSAALDTPVVVDGRFGPVLLRVTEIAPAARQPFEEVAATLKKEIAEDTAEREMLALYDQIEDARASGSTLKEIADRFKLEFVTVEGVDREGKGPDGSPREVPQKDALLGAVFTTDQGSEADPVQFGRRGFAWFDVTEVTPARDRTLDEVRPAVTAAWTADEEAKALASKADEIAQKVRDGETLEAAAAALGTEVQTAGPFKRGATVPGLTADAVSAAFAAGKGSVATAPSPDGGRTVLAVTDVVDPAFFAESPQMQQLSDELSRAVGNSLLTEFVTDREAAAGVSINQPTLMRVIGLDRDAAGS
jgi:peptidyl-prolyl cis-trans isomerase D